MACFFTIFFKQEGAWLMGGRIADFIHTVQRKSNWWSIILWSFFFWRREIRLSTSHTVICFNLLFYDVMRRYTLQQTFKSSSAASGSSRLLRNANERTNAAIASAEPHKSKRWQDRYASFHYTYCFSYNNVFSAIPNRDTYNFGLPSFSCGHDYRPVYATS